MVLIYRKYINIWYLCIETMGNIENMVLFMLLISRKYVINNAVNIDMNK